MSSQGLHFAPEPSVAVMARNFEESPFIRRTERPGMVRGVYAGRYYPSDLGEDPVEAYWDLRQKACLYDVPEKPLLIEGPDAVAFLEYVLSRKLSALPIGRGAYAVACTPQGGIFMDGVVFRLAPDRFWFVQADGPFEAWLLSHAQGYDVAITDPKSWVLQVQGPASPAILHAASEGAVDLSLPYFRADYFDLGGQRLLVSRTGFTNELGFEIYCDGATTDHLALWDHLMACGAPHGLRVSGLRSMNMRRIEGGILNNLTDMDQTMTPFDAGLAGFVDMDKDGFVGQAALQGKDRRPRLFGLTCATAIPAGGWQVLDGNARVGAMRCGTLSPTLGKGIGYVLFDTPDSWVGRTLTLQDPEGGQHDARVVSLPFFDAEKSIVRGKDRSIPDRTGP